MSTLVMAYSMFGMVGFISEMVSPTPIVQVIASGLTLFSYAAIAILSKRMNFRELFHALMPLNIINAIRSYADLGLMVIKYQGSIGELSRMASEYIYLRTDAHAANVTITPEMITDALGPDGLFFIESLNNTGLARATAVNNTASFVQGLPVVGEAWEVIGSLPDWVVIVPLVVLGIYAVLDSIIPLISNVFLIISSIPVLFILAMAVALTRSNAAYIQIGWLAWMPIAATVDSFIRIYIFRAVFFRLLSKNPLIRSYAERGI